MEAGTRIIREDEDNRWTKNEKEEVAVKIDTLEQFAGRFGALLEKKPERAELLKNGRELLSELVRNPDWFRPTLSRLVLDEAFLKSQWQSIDQNEIQIYRDGSGLFSIRAYIWEPGATYPIHDHGAWGVVGAHLNRVMERKFKRMDDGATEEYADLRQASEQTLSPGETTFVLPLNEGIHQMQAVDNRTAVTIHVYGAPVRKGYIHYFDAQEKSAWRMYAPAVAKKVLAIRALGSVPEAWAEEVLCRALDDDKAEYIREECRDALSKLRG